MNVAPEPRTVADRKPTPAEITVLRRLRMEGALANRPDGRSVGVRLPTSPACDKLRKRKWIERAVGGWRVSAEGVTVLERTDTLYEQTPY